MRLSQDEINSIIEAIGPYVENTTSELRLYGSRTKDNLRGGDIDLLLITEANIKDHLHAKKHYILAAIKKNLGDQKIDLLIVSRDELDRDPFPRMVFPDSKLLKQW